MPKLQFLTVCESAGTLTEKNVCKVVSINTDPFAKKKTLVLNRSCRKTKKKIVYKPRCGWKINHWQNNVRGERSAHFYTALFCPCEAVDLFLKQRGLAGQGKDY